MTSVYLPHPGHGPAPVSPQRAGQCPGTWQDGGAFCIDASRQIDLQVREGGPLRCQGPSMEGVTSIILIPCVGLSNTLDFLLVQVRG